MRRGGSLSSPRYDGLRLLGCHPGGMIPASLGPLSRRTGGAGANTARSSSSAMRSMQSVRSRERTRAKNGDDTDFLRSDSSARKLAEAARSVARIEPAIGEAREGTPCQNRICAGEVTFREAVALRTSGSARANNKLGFAYAMACRGSDAACEFERVARPDPSRVRARVYARPLREGALAANASEEIRAWPQRPRDANPETRRCRCRPDCSAGPDRCQGGR